MGKKTEATGSVHTYQLDIDINGEPPSVEALAQRRRAAEAAIVKTTRGDRALGATAMSIVLCALVGIVVLGAHLIGRSPSLGTLLPTMMAGLFADLFVIWVGYSVWSGLHDEWIKRPRRRANKALAALEQLGANRNDPKSEHACIDYDRFVAQHPEIAAYQARVAALGRRPVMAELNAARNWITSAPQRQEDEGRRRQSAQADQERRQAAEQACARLSPSA